MVVSRMAAISEDVRLSKLVDCRRRRGRCWPAVCTSERWMVVLCSVFVSLQVRPGQASEETSR